MERTQASLSRSRYSCRATEYKTEISPLNGISRWLKSSNHCANKVLIVGSGNIVHNLRAISFAHIRQAGAAYEWAEIFRNGINQAILNRDNETLVHYLRLGEPAALSVPTPEHYLPLLYIMALRDGDDEARLFNDEIVGGSLSMPSVLLGQNFT